jgi:hypothetical protein
MRKKISEIIGNFQFEKFKNDKRIAVFAVCILIATGLWFLNALEKDYSATLSYPVKYVNPPNKLFLANTPPSKFEVNVEAHGFTLLRYKLTFPFSPLEIDLSVASQNMESNGKAILIPTGNLIRQIGDQVSKEITVTNVSPETISLVFDSLKTKTVPVVPRVTLNYSPQFSLRRPVTVIPESIKISGPAAVIDTIQYLYTEPEVFDDLDKETERVVSVSQPPNTYLSAEKVTLHILVEKFTEKTVILPVQVLHQPEGYKVKLFPPQVSVSFMVGLSDFESVTAAGFSVAVNYEQAVSESTTLDVFVEMKPPFIQLLKVSPGRVEYLIESE